MNNWKLAFALATAVMGLTVSVAVHAQQSSTGASKPEAKADSSQVHRIVLPKYPPEIPGGPNVETYSKNCLICHTGALCLNAAALPQDSMAKRGQENGRRLWGAHPGSRSGTDRGVPGCGEGSGSAGHTYPAEMSDE